MPVPRGLASEGQHLCRAITPEGRHVGSVWFGVRRDRGQPYAYIWDLHVEEDARGQGHGERIMRLVEQRALALGLGYISLNVFGHNGTARRLYERLGYEVESVGMGKRLERDVEA